jgi:YVTN family beta-propeller protein
VVPIDVATNTTGDPIVLGGPGTNFNAIAITPDGTRAYVVDSASDVVVPIDLLTRAVGGGIPVGSVAAAIAITPDGRIAYVANTGGDNVTPIDLTTNAPGAAIPAGRTPTAIAISADGAMAYVTNAETAELTPIVTATNTPGQPIPVGTAPSAVVVTPDSAKAYVSNFGDGTVTPIDLVTRAPGDAITVGTGPMGLAVTPDQAPRAAFTVTPGAAGATTTFDASASTVAFGTIAGYSWEFGDGTRATSTTPVVEHTYTASGTYTATVTAVSSGGTSTSRAFTGQTMSRNGGPQAVASLPVDIRGSLGESGPTTTTTITASMRPRGTLPATGSGVSGSLVLPALLVLTAGGAALVASRRRPS